jgi:hypothetical protein
MTSPANVSCSFEAEASVQQQRLPFDPERPTPGLQLLLGDRGTPRAGAVAGAVRSRSEVRPLRHVGRRYQRVPRCQLRPEATATSRSNT